jgi:hypothetical protein
MRRIVAYDVALIIWAATWIVVGLLVYRGVRDLAELSKPIVDASVALDETADGLAQVASVPFVGEAANLAEIEERVRRASASARRSARVSREGVRELAVLLGFAIALVPTLPLVAIYLPVRRDWRRARRIKA